MLVILSHLNVVGFVTLPLALRFSGAWGVGIFLLLSGFGLACSYKKWGLGREYFYKRFAKVVLPYSLVTGVWLVLDIALFGTSYPLKAAALALIALDFSSIVDPTMWFITFIVLWYVLFYLVFKLPLADAYKVALLFALAYLLKYYPAPIIGSRTAWQWSLHAYLFPAGALAGLYWSALSSKAGVRMSPRNLNPAFLGVAAISLAAFALFVLDSLKDLQSYSIANFAFALFAICLVVVAGSAGFKSRLLLIIGSFSFELYLLEWALMEKYRLLFIFESKPLSLLSYSLALAAAAVLLKQLTDYLSGLLGVGRYAAPALQELPIASQINLAAKLNSQTNPAGRLKPDQLKTDQLVEES